MALRVRLFPCLSDNYGFLARDEASGEVACIDTPEAGPILAEAERLGWRISLILNTHWHPDHTGGNAAVKAATGARVIAPAKEAAKIAAVDETVGEGDLVRLGETAFQVLETPGHTLGHVSYHAAEAKKAFVGDTLFVMGCGRLFEGTAEMMWASLQRLAALPENTALYCAHEYTAANARFALSVDDDAEVAERARTVFRTRDAEAPTIPTFVFAERETNPMLRAPLLKARLGLGDDASDVDAFAAMRAAKDAFRG